MNLVLKSCKADAQGIVVTVEDTETGKQCAAAISARTCGGPFLQHEASVRQLLADTLVAVNMMNAPPVEAATEPAPAPLRPSKAPKGAA